MPCRLLSLFFHTTEDFTHQDHPLTKHAVFKDGSEVAESHIAGSSWHDRPCLCDQYLDDETRQPSSGYYHSREWHDRLGSWFLTILPNIVIEEIGQALLGLRLRSPMSAISRPSVGESIFRQWPCGSPHRHLALAFIDGLGQYRKVPRGIHVIPNCLMNIWYR